MDWLKPVLDTYDRGARLKPALLAGLPLAASIVLLIPEFGVVWGSIAGLVIYSGGSMLMIQIGRDQGRTLEARLYESWGGKPSVAMLRHSDNRLDRLTKERYRRFLHAAVPDLTLPSVEEEMKNPKLADKALESANAWLLEQTRDHDRFALLFKENTNYGFRRNLAGLKMVALVMDAMAGALVLWSAVPSWTGEFVTTGLSLSLEWWASLVLMTVHSWYFVVHVRGKWVLFAAENYAQRLLAACDVLSGANDVDKTKNN